VVVVKRKKKWRQGWTSWRADPALLKALDEVADRREQSRSTVMRSALREFIERESGSSSRNVRG
jgi:predicted transcriptional regulator